MDHLSNKLWDSFPAKELERKLEIDEIMQDIDVTDWIGWVRLPDPPKPKIKKKTLEIVDRYIECNQQEVADKILKFKTYARYFKWHIKRVFPFYLRRLCKLIYEDLSTGTLYIKRPMEIFHGLTKGYFSMVRIIDKSSGGGLLLVV